MVQSTVPDFFQEEDALRSQADWLIEEVGVGDAFFARLVGTDEATFSDWRARGAELPSGGEEILRRFWRTVLHLLSFLNFDAAKVRGLFRQPIPVRPSGGASPLGPPWGGSSLAEYLERTGPGAIEKVDGWVTGLRFGDLYAG